MMMHRAWAACALVLLLWPAAPAWADTRTDARRYFNRGMEAIQEGRTREGIDLLEQAYELRPHPNVLFNIARAYASLNEVDDAVRYFDKYLESNPPDRGPTDQVLAELRERQRLRRLVDDGMNAVASGRYIEGVALLARAYAERPHPNLLFNIGRAYESAGEFKQAVEAYQGYLESKPPDSAQVAEKVRVLEEKVRSQAARAGGPVASAPPTKSGGAGVALDEDGMRKLAAEIAGLLRDQGRGVGAAGGGSVGSLGPGPGVGGPVDVRVRGSTAALDEAGVSVAAKDGAAYEEVVVTASRREQSPLDAPNAVTIISEEDIRLSGARNIPDLLRRVPGMDVMAMTASDWNVSMRGFNRRVANKILVLIDGRSVYLDFLGATLWQTLALDVMDIERIEVVRGPGSAIYGAYAYTGIINIITKKPEAIDGSTLRLDVGSGNVARGTYQVGRREGKVGFRATAAFEQANKFEREFGDRVDFTTLATDPNLSFRAAYIDADVEYELPNGGRLHGGGSASFGKLEFYGVSVLRNQLIEMRPLANARVGYSGDLFSVLAFWQGTRVVSSPEYFRTGLASLGSNVIADLFSIEPVFRPTFTLLGEHQLVLGAEYRHKYISWDYLSGEQSEDHFALFAQDQWAINPRFTVLASARLDKHPLIGFLGSPRLALIFKPTPKSALRASVGTAFRQPTQAETYLALAASSPVAGVAVRLVGGGSALEPERIVTFDVGYLQQLDSAELELVAYVNRIDNLITRSALQPTTISTPFDTGLNAFVGAQSFFQNDPRVYYAFGGEAAARLFPVDGLDVGLSYAFQYIVDLDTGDRFTDSPLHKATLWAQYRARFGLDLGASVHLVSDQAWVEPNFDQTDPSGFDTTPLPIDGSVVVVARAGYRLFDDQLELAIAGSNLADIGASRHLEHPYANQVEARVVGSITARF
jgi:iron complex outermembrane receptor protein